MITYWLHMLWGTITRDPVRVELAQIIHENHGTFTVKIQRTDRDESQVWQDIWDRAIDAHLGANAIIEGQNVTGLRCAGSMTRLIGFAKGLES